MDWRKASGESQVYPLRLSTQSCSVCTPAKFLVCFKRSFLSADKHLYYCTLWNVAVIFIFSWVDTFKYAFRYTVCDRKVAFTAVIWFFYATVRLPKAFLWLHQTTCSPSSSAEMCWKKRKRLCCADRLMRWAQQHVATQKRRRRLFLRYVCRNCSLFLRLQWVV